MSLQPESFLELKSLLSSFVAKFIIWSILSMLAYHIVAGIRHLFMDGGMGETLATARATSYGVIILGIIFSIILGVYIW